jgi:hypothetical protein
MSGIGPGLETHQSAFLRVWTPVQAHTQHRSTEAEGVTA